MNNLIRHLSASLLLIAGCQVVPQSSILPPQTTTDFVTELEIVPETNRLDEWFTPTTKENDPYPSVCSLHRYDGSLIGSGILIGKDVVLTAGHCINANDVFSIIIGEEEIMVKETVLHPDYSKPSFSVSNDIGLIFLDCDSDYEPARIGCVEWMYRYMNITTVGYSHEYKKFSKWGVFNFFGVVTSEPKEIKFVPRNGASVWFGDSGGGVFAKFGSKEYVVGIISTFMVIRGFEDREEYISECSAVNIAVYLDWINGEILHEQMREIINGKEMEQLEEIVEDGR